MDNTVCPTCTQDIEESFQNKIDDVQNKAKELKEGFDELESTIKFEQQRERQFNDLSKEITNLVPMVFLKTILGLAKSTTNLIWNRKFKELPTTLQTEILNMKS